MPQFAGFAAANLLGALMFQLFCKRMLVFVLLASYGCAYTFKETGHRDLDRSVRAADKCCGCAAIGAMYTAIGGLWLWSHTNNDCSEKIDGNFEPSQNYQVVP